MINCLRTEADLISAALSLGARRVRGWSAAEERLASSATPFDRVVRLELTNRIRAGHDPLGTAFCELRTPERRRGLGATYTPACIVGSMVRWARAQDREPTRVIEPGAGSARFLLAAGKEFTSAELIAVEVDPVPAMIARANLASVGFGDRASVLVRDYPSLELPSVDGVTLFIGNPPYVRHHQIDFRAKQWLTATAGRLGYTASQLAGLHVYFFLATAGKARRGDCGVFITAAEWLDVNYGRLVRELFLNGLGGQSLTVIEPAAMPFEDAAATAAISTFVVGSTPESIRVSRVADSKNLGNLRDGQQVCKGRLVANGRWSCLTRKKPEIPEGYIELGELCQVHRGQVTGANRIWIAGTYSDQLPRSVLFRTITRARELFAAGAVLSDVSSLRDVIDLPANLDALPREQYRLVLRFLKYAAQAGAATGYIAKARRAWWSVGLRAPAPILATYMARRPPIFVRNIGEARHINIAHGLYPRESLSSNVLDNLAGYLSRTVSVHDGRTYAGGLTKFEPREMERLIVPSPEMLKATVATV